MSDPVPSTESFVSAYSALRRQQGTAQNVRATITKTAAVRARVAKAAASRDLATMPMPDVIRMFVSGSDDDMTAAAIEIATRVVGATAAANTVGGAI